jgi:hypothetical protein
MQRTTSKRSNHRPFHCGSALHSFLVEPRSAVWYDNRDADQRHLFYGRTCRFFAGGGVEGRSVYGATDEFGVHAIEDICHFHDPHVKLLHQCGIDQARLPYPHGARNFRLTDVKGPRPA